MKDIANSKDIQFLVDSFYQKVVIDNVIGPFFTEVVKVNWEKHLPVMYTFWENTLFYTGNYKGNIIEKHQNVSNISKLNQEHLNRWMDLWTQTIHENFEGEKANEAISKADTIGKVMFLKIKG
jgi:hemoglobin